MKNISKKDVAAILIFIALIVAFVLLITNITNKSSGRELRIVREAVKNAALTCYVVEGTYPAVGDSVHLLDALYVVVPECHS